MVFPGPPVVVADPWKWSERVLRADLVLVTDRHVDRCCGQDLALASHEATVAAGPASASGRLCEVFGDRARILEPGQSLEFRGVRVVAIAAQAPERVRGFVPDGSALSYLLETDRVRALLMGPGAATDEHEGLRPDVAFVAVGGRTGPDLAEAVETVRRVRPTVAVPIHWGDLHGRFDVPSRFVERCAELGIEARIAH